MVGEYEFVYTRQYNEIADKQEKGEEELYGGHQATSKSHLGKAKANCLWMNMATMR